MKPTTAVIFAAGSGTRFLPLTAAVQKELLPIINRPVIDYLVADLVAAGIKRIIFVIRPGQTGLKDYYLGNPAYEEVLARLGKTDALNLLDSVHRQAAFEFVEQPLNAGYGTAVPFEAALPLLDTNAPVLVCSGDDFVWRSDGTSEMSAFVETFKAKGGDGAIMARELPEAVLRHYGVLKTEKIRGTEYLKAIVERPAPGQAPSRLVNLSKYIFSPSLFNYVEAVTPHPSSGERYLVDALTAACTERQVVVHRALGAHLDTGTPANWLRANQIMADALSDRK